MRQARITASRCADLMTKGKGKEFGDTAINYAKEIVLVRLGFIPEDITTWQMEWGIEHEADARAIYAASRGIEVVMPGFMLMGSDPLNVGATPDGLVEDNGLLEIKCPQWKAHADYLLNGPPKNYWQQMQFQMMVTGREWCDFMTFHPEFPEKLQAKVVRIKRDQDYIDAIQERILLFKELIEDLTAQFAALM